MPLLKKQWESENGDRLFLRLTKHVHNTKSNSCWRSLYTFEKEPIGRGFAGKVYKIKPKTDESCTSTECPPDEITASCAGDDFAATYYACKAIRRWRCGKDTMNRIKRELKALYRLQMSIDKNSLLSRCQESASLNELKSELQHSPLLPSPPKSASPRLVAFHEDEMEVAIVMEFANGGSLYDLCKEVYETPRFSLRAAGCHEHGIYSRTRLTSPKFNKAENCPPCGDTHPWSSNVLIYRKMTESDVKNANLPECYVIQVVRKLISAILYMHTHLRMVHLDIKAENVMLREPYPSTDVFLTDFGLATELSEDKQHRELAGTPDYAAPEIINYDPISFATDMWSMGVLTYFLLTGVSPFLAEEKEITMQNVTHGPINFPNELFSARSPEALQFVQGLLIRKPNARLTAEQCLQHPWLRNIHDSAIDLASCSPCSDADTFTSFSDEINVFADSEHSDHELKSPQKFTCHSWSQRHDKSITPRLQPTVQPDDEVTQWSDWNRGYFSDVVVQAKGTDRLTIIQCNQMNRSSCSSLLRPNFLWVEGFRKLLHRNNLNLVLLHMPELNLHYIYLRETTRAGEVADQTMTMSISVPTSREPRTPWVVTGCAMAKRRNPSLPSSTEKQRTYCVEVHMKLTIPTTQQLALATEHACSTLIYIPGSNSSILGRNSYSLFRGLDNGSQPIRSNSGLLCSNRMSASLDCLYLASLSSLLSPSHTSIDSSQSHQSKLNQSKLCLLGTEQTQSFDGPSKENSLNSRSKYHLWSPSNKANVNFCHLVRSFRETLTRAARFFSTPVARPLFNLHKPRNTRT
ncbi:Serine/threonine-protein kinase 17A [Fasciola gigantica]|uniref:Serine/threonine-protein kinase 17A n=1 Tax=Fasciola gigantica TaxID=46835 RepID=A0A504Y4B3_FASGI|nr:Serine/threonine-protein kinase 17A [Fasciola gigantica]